MPARASGRRRDPPSTRPPDRRLRRGLERRQGVDEDGEVDRIDSIGVTTSDLQVMLEATKHLPKEQYERLQRELAALGRKRRGP